MGPETKVGLTVGVIFIFLFGAILCVRASTQVEHADFLADSSGDLQRIAFGRIRSGGAGDRAAALEIPTSADAGPGEVKLVQTETREPEPAGGRVAPVAEETRAPAPPKTEPAAARTYVVRARDTLTVIARRFYGAEGGRLWRRIWEANRDRLDDPNTLVVGQKLVIPGLRTAPPEPERSAPAPRPGPARDGVRTVTADELEKMLGARTDLVEARRPGPETYTVGKGETFYSIAMHLYGDPKSARLLELRNRHLVPDARHLKVGQRILLLEGLEAAPGERTAMR